MQTEGQYFPVLTDQCMVSWKKKGIKNTTALKQGQIILHVCLQNLKLENLKI